MSAVPQRHRPPEENVDSWLMSYADMVTLLLSFFIIFVSVSEPKREQFTMITRGLANKFGSVDLSTPFNGVFTALSGVIENRQLIRDVAIERTERSIAMELASGTFFKKDSAQLRDDRLEALGDLAEAMKSGHYLDYRIIIEAHTSDVPINTPIYPSNWELSSARAARVVRFFAERGIAPERMVAVGHADTRPKVPNIDGSGRPIEANRDLNQRIVITFERVI